MVTLELYNESYKINNEIEPVAVFNTFNKLNIITGDSGSGKSLFIENMILALRNIDDWYFECNKEVKVITLANIDIMFDKKYKENLFILDEDVSEVIRSRLKDIKNSNNYFVIIDRSLELKIDTNVKAVFTLKMLADKKCNGITPYIFQNKFKLQPGDTDKMDTRLYEYIITEDSTSGKQFWSMFKKLKLIDYPNLQGNGDMYKKLEIIQSKLNGKKILVALDYDRGSIAINKIITNDNIDNKNITFINMESFEEIICNSEFILSKFPEMRDKVINYQNYIDASYKSTANYFNELLYKYVRVQSPIKENGERNSNIFYSKGMKNFKQCFVDNCCSFNKYDCVLYTNQDKRCMMVSNKFENLKIFL